MEILLPVLTIVLAATAILWGWVLAPKVTKNYLVPALECLVEYFKELRAQVIASRRHLDDWRHDESKLML